MTFWMTYAALCVVGVLGVLAVCGLCAELVRDLVRR